MMKHKPTNYARFYALVKRLAGDREQIKETLVARFTRGRTCSLREMTSPEYEAMCSALEAELEHPGMSVEEFQRERKRLRSAVLHRMQRLGIDTSDWEVVDAFCLDRRIAGREFARLTLAELEALIPKLEALGRKGYERPRKVLLPLILRQDQLPS